VLPKIGIPDPSELAVRHRDPVKLVISIGRSLMGQEWPILFSRDVREGTWPRSPGDAAGSPNGWGIHSRCLFPSGCRVHVGFWWPTEASSQAGRVPSRNRRTQRPHAGGSLYGQCVPHVRLMRGAGPNPAMTPVACVAIQCNTWRMICGGVTRTPITSGVAGSATPELRASNRSGRLNPQAIPAVSCATPIRGAAAARFGLSAIRRVRDSLSQ